MEHKLENGVLTLFFKGDLNSSNSEQTEEEIEKILGTNKFQSIVLDFAELRYISSAGLRIILKIKKEHDDTKVVKVNKDVYDIFEMVGFSSVITIERA